MPRGSSREFREKYDGAAARLGISGASANRVDSVFLARARGALKAQGFSVDGRNVSRIFQEDADLATVELGLSTFAAQTQSVNWPTDGSTDVLKNDSNLAIGIANLWSIGVWWKPVVPLGPSGNFLVTIGNSNNGSASRINIYHDQTGPDRIRVDWGTSAGVLRLMAVNGFYTGENGNWVHVLVTWEGTTLFVEKNGSPFGSNTPAATVMDDLPAGRQFAVGNLHAAGGNNLSIEGNVAQVAVWNADVRPAQAVLNASPSALNLNADSGAYVFSGNLAHWHRVGHEAAPTIGRDYAEAGITPTISVDTNSVGITDGDRQADVP